MHKLNSLKGSENLPQKENDVFIGINICGEREWNMCVDSLHSIELTGEVEELAKVLWHDSRKEALRRCFGKLPMWDKLEPLARKVYIKKARVLINAMPSWVRLTKGK